jgi:hypothetical protein
MSMSGPCTRIFAVSSTHWKPKLVPEASHDCLSAAESFAISITGRGGR